jgi:hypothetical protein
VGLLSVPTSIKYFKTEKGRGELSPGVRTLSQKERTFLLLATGQRSLADISKVLPGDEVALAQQLLAKGFIEVPAAPVPAKPKSRASKPSTAPLPAPVDAFEGKRSLAATRMYLFDMAERTFSRRDPEFAERLRSDLREARDRDSMLAVSRQLVQTIERIAGAERATQVQGRIAKLLPPELTPELVT